MKMKMYNCAKFSTMKVVFLISFLFVATCNLYFPVDAQSPLDAGIKHDYYWRPFDGLIPDKDAVEGTFDGNTRTYVGSVHIFGEGVFVGELYDNNKSITVTLRSNGSVVRETKDIMILCSGDRDRFKWFPTTWKNVDTVPYHKVVVGREEPNSVLYAGRVTYDGKLKIGKVSNKLYIAQGQNQVEFIAFEILTYRTD